MIKATTLFYLMLVGMMAQAQNGLFETVLTAPFDNNITDVAPHPLGWISVGYEDHCISPFITRIDSSGNVVWQYKKVYYFGFALYNTIAESNNGYYIAGHNMIADDYPAPEANGFVDFLDFNDSVVNVVTDTTYKGGFHKIAINDSLILVSALKEHYDAKVPFVVCYDTEGNWLWEHEFVNRDIVNVHFMDSLIWVVTDSFTYQMSLQGQVLPGSIAAEAIASYIANDTAIALVDRYNYANLFDIHFNFTIFKTFGLSHFQLVDIYSTVADKHYALMLDNSAAQLIITREGGVPSNWVELPDYCTKPVALALKDSIIAVGGYLQSDEIESGVLRTADLQEHYYHHQSDITVVACSLYVDTFLSRDLNTPPIIISATFNGRLDVWAVNSGPDTLASFLLHTERISQFNCSQNYADSLFSNIALAPSDSVMVTFNLNYTEVFLINNDRIEYDVYAIGPNHKLTNSCPQGFNSTPYVFVGIEDPKQAEAINVFPNPFASTVSFTNLPIGAITTIYNLQGTELKRDAENTTIDLSQLLPGMYIYKVSNKAGNTIKTGKLVKE